MKRFSKILTLILAIVAILTAFTVVALAEVEGGQAKTAGTQTFEDVTAVEHPAEGGVYYAEDYPGGNKYLAFSLQNGTSLSDRPEKILNVTGSNANYRVKDYPIMALDFDFMTPDGTLGQRDNATNSAAIRFRPYYSSNPANLAGTTRGGYAAQITFYQMGLSREKYLWQHVTVIVEWHGATSYKYYVYVNGGDEPTYSTDITTYAAVSGITDEVAETLLWGNTYFYGRRYAYHANDPFGRQYIDNVKCTYFSAEYKEDIASVGKHIFNGEYTMPESYTGTVATVTVGETVKYFDDLGEACEFANAKPGSVAVRVNDDKTTTPFSQIYPSVEIDGVAKYFADLGDAAAFAAANPGSKLTLVGNITANYTVDSEITIDARKVDSEGNFTGEFYTGVDTYAKTTKGYYVVETDTPGVYQSVKGDFMVSQTDGSYIAYPASEFTARIFKANSTTLKLLNDIEVDEVFKVNKTNYTIDLNGYALKRISYYGDVYNYNEAVGDYEKADTGISSKGTTMFTLNYASGAHSYGFLITSSNGQGKIYNINYKADQYYNGGKLVKRDNLVSQRTYLLYTTASYTETGNKFTFENFDHYGGIILNVSYDGRENLNFYFDNIRHYQMNTYASNNAQFAFYLSASKGFNLQVTNSLFYFNDHANNDTSGLIKLTAALTDGYTTDIKFTNCDIIANDDGADRVEVINNQSAEQIQLVDCRVYNMGDANKVAASNGTISNVVNDGNSVAAVSPLAAAGWTNMVLAQSISKTYTVPDIYTWAFTTEGEVQSVNTAVKTKEYLCTYTNIATKEVDVKIGDKTVSLMPGVSDLYAKELRVYAEESDNLLNKVYILKDANGNVYESVLGFTENGFAFDWDSECILSASEKTKLVGGIEAPFNLGFLTGFRYNLYLPVDERLTYITVEGFKKEENIVFIDDKEYYVYSKVVSTQAAAAADTIVATFKVDGEDYSQTWSINAVIYAGLVLNGSDIAVEKNAIGYMLNFIKEAVTFDNAAADVADIDTLITKSGVAVDYAKDYPAGEGDALDEEIEINYVIFNGVAAYKISCAAPLSFKTADGVEIVATPDEDAMVLEAMRVYDIIKPITITNTDSDVSMEYSILDYIAAHPEVKIVKALYDFGNAAESYKAYLKGNG